jgi:hypothetical protein
VYALLQLPKQSAISRLQLLHHPIQIPPYVQKLYYWPKFKFRETQEAAFNFFESQTSLVELIQVSRPQLTINEHLGLLPTGTSYSMNYVLRSVKVLGFTELQNSYQFDS